MYSRDYQCVLLDPVSYFTEVIEFYVVIISANWLLDFRENLLRSLELWKMKALRLHVIAGFNSEILWFYSSLKVMTNIIQNTIEIPDTFFKKKDVLKNIAWVTGFWPCVLIWNEVQKHNEFFIAGKRQYMATAVERTFIWNFLY